LDGQRAGLVVAQAADTEERPELGEGGGEAAQVLVIVVGQDVNVLGQALGAVETCRSPTSRYWTR
jgi:hypothetical protein